MDRSTLVVILVAILAGAAIGFAVSWLLWGDDATHYVAESFKPPIHHEDGSETAPVLPASKPDFPMPSKPAGGTHVRTVEVTIMPPPPEGTPAVGAPDTPVVGAVPCPPIKVRVDIDRFDDGLRASVWSNGEILDTADFPIENIVPIPPKHGIGAAVFTDGSKELSYTRFFKRASISGYVREEDNDIVAGVGAQILLR